MADDPQTSLAFPSVWNYCNHAEPVEAVATDHQQKYCLTARYVNCPVFMRSATGPLPSQIREPSQYSGRTGAALKTFIVVGAIVMIILISGMAILQSRNQVNQQVLIVTNTPYIEPSQTASAPPEPALPAPTFTPTPNLVQSPLEFLGTEFASTRAPHDIGSLIGVDYLFRIHRVAWGENLEIIAQRDGTSIDAISAVNYQFTTPLWLDQIIVIPVNRTDVSGLPAFQAFRIPQPILVEDLATQQAVDASILKYYNALPDGTLLLAGEWVLIPRQIP